MKVVKYIAFGLGLFLILIFGYMKISGKNFSELALDIFSWYKKTSGNRVQLDDIVYDESIVVDHSEWSKLLHKHVSLNGNVDYKGILNNRLALEDYLNTLSTNPPNPSLSKNEKLAYWINAYNAFTVKLIIDHYPLNSIKDISDGLPMINSPWDIKFFKIGGVDFDLNTIEHEILRKQFDEPRIHFAINCASFSCPKLRNEAFEAKNLENQLQDQASDFINDSTKNQITDTAINVSSIFKWFKSDFTKNGSLHEYLRLYNSKIDPKNNIVFGEYDWMLNEE